MTNPSNPNEQDPRKTTIDADSGETVTEAELTQAETLTEDEDADMADFDPSSLDPSMFAGVQEMMEKLQKADDLERENADLKGRLARLAADFESFRRRTADDASEARNKGTADAAEALMPIYDDLSRATEMGSADPAKLVPGMQNVMSKVLNVFEKLGLQSTGREGETFDPQWHEALQVVPGEQDDTVVQVFQLGFRMGDRLVRPARVVVSRKA
ncbi:nucleotide exchange factor GrpE [Deinococcus aquiradiocola]|uniref:Protein GrpE n=1 Tax=Deinococcus aquiradiocola TaxID=393059 RepID=A0A917PKR7_9DEIO|nr:nucleotide exchange factor GrpE [Deinococcus aquiradiocola]GGJ82577.1 protein GrpE [Deinococcus aquiradiocola]